jgi:macrolide-specific efflux system membrane fusion protein
MDRTDESHLAPKAAQRATKPRVKRSRLTRSAITLAVALSLGAGGYYGYGAWSGASSSAAQYTTAIVQRGDLEDSVTATGILQPRDYVDVGTQVSGQVKKLHIEIGSIVKAGQLLAEIDPTVYTSKVDADRAQLRTQEAQLADKQAQLALAEQQFKRQTNMQRENATTQDAVDTAAAALRSAKAQIDVLKAQADQTRSSLRGNEANLSYTKIYAPMAGTVVSQAAKQGQTLNANQQAPIVLRIADLSTMTVQSQVSEADISKLRVGMDVYFTTLGSQSKRWYGKLRQIEPTPVTVNNVVLYNALFDVENPDRALMTQMTAQVFFVTAHAKDAVLVPITALRPVSRRGEGAGKGGDRSADSAGKGGERSTDAAGKGGERSTDAAGKGGERSTDAAGKAAERSADGTRSRAAGGERGGNRAQGSRGADADPRVRFASGRAMVRVMKADGALEEREVKVGVMSRISAEIVSGLEAGEQVVTGTASPRPAAATKSGNSSAPRMQPRI